MDSLEFDYGPADQPQYTLPHHKTKVTAQTRLALKAINHAYRRRQSTWPSSSKTICFRGSKLFSSRKVPRVSGSAQAQVAHRWVRCGDVLTASDGRLSVANVAVGRTSGSHSTMSRHGRRHTTLPIGCGQLVFASTLATMGSCAPTPPRQPAMNSLEHRTRSGRTCVGTGSHTTLRHRATPKGSTVVPW
jgi:predicted RNA binding protein YcfA (HicA-like mRNA interferase family)